MLKIYGRANSSNVQMVMWCIGELGIAHERLDIGGSFGGLDAPDYVAMNPNGLVPTMDDNGFILWESNAIIRYLAARHGTGSLWPLDPYQRASADRWMDWQLSTVDSAMWPLFRNLIRTAPAQRSAKEIDGSLAKMIRCLEILDRYLDGQAFVCGRELTVGDIPLGMMAYRFFALPITHPDVSNVRAWYKRLTERAPFRQHVMLPLV